MDSVKRPISPFTSLFAGSDAATVIDFLLSRDQHQTTAEIHAGTSTSMNRVSEIIERLLDIDVVGIGACDFYPVVAFQNSYRKPSISKR